MEATRGSGPGRGEPERDPGSAPTEEHGQAGAEPQAEAPTQQEGQPSGYAEQPQAAAPAAGAWEGAQPAGGSLAPYGQQPYGYPAQGPVYPVAVVGPKTNGLAVASMVLGILWLWWVGSILALVFGMIAKSQIESSGGTQQGRGMAISGIVLGWVGVGILLVFIVGCGGCAALVPLSGAGS